jgi:hypothetical protein
VLGLVVGYSGEASRDVYRVADLVATRLSSKQPEYIRTSTSIAKAMQTQRICRAWGPSFARGFARLILDRVRDNLDQAPGSRNWGSELDADAEFNFFTRPRREKAVLKGLFPDTPIPRLLALFAPEQPPLHAPVSPSTKIAPAGVVER